MTNNITEMWLCSLPFMLSVWRFKFVITSSFGWKPSEGAVHPVCLALCLPLALIIGTVHPEMKVLSSFINLHVAAYDFLYTWNTKETVSLTIHFYLCGYRCNESEW